MPINVPPHQEKKGFWGKFFDVLKGTAIAAGTVAAGAVTGGAALPLGIAAGASAFGSGVASAAGKDKVAGALGEAASVGGGITNMTAGAKGKPVGIPQNTPPKPDMFEQAPSNPISPTALNAPRVKPTQVEILSQDNPAVDLQRVQDGLAATKSLPLNERGPVEAHLMQTQDELLKRVMANRVGR